MAEPSPFLRAYQARAGTGAGKSAFAQAMERQGRDAAGRKKPKSRSFWRQLTDTVVNVPKGLVWLGRGAAEMPFVYTKNALGQIGKGNWSNVGDMATFGLFTEGARPEGFEGGGYLAPALLSSFHTTGMNLRHPSRYGKAVREGRIVDTVLEDLGNVAIVGGVAAKAIGGGAAAGSAAAKGGGVAGYLSRTGNSAAAARVARLGRGLGRVSKLGGAAADAPVSVWRSGLRGVRFGVEDPAAILARTGMAAPTKGTPGYLGYRARSAASRLPNVESVLTRVAPKLVESHPLLLTRRGSEILNQAQRRGERRASVAGRLATRPLMRAAASMPDFDTVAGAGPLNPAAAGPGPTPGPAPGGVPGGGPPPNVPWPHGLAGIGNGPTAALATQMGWRPTIHMTAGQVTSVSFPTGTPTRVRAAVLDEIRAQVQRAAGLPTGRSRLAPDVDPSTPTGPRVVTPQTAAGMPVGRDRLAPVDPNAPAGGPVVWPQEQVGMPVGRDRLAPVDDPLDIDALARERAARPAPTPQPVPTQGVLRPVPMTPARGPRSGYRGQVRMPRSDFRARQMYGRLLPNEEQVPPSILDAPNVNLEPPALGGVSRRPLVIAAAERHGLPVAAVDQAWNVVDDAVERLNREIEAAHANADNFLVASGTTGGLLHPDWLQQAPGGEYDWWFHLDPVQQQFYIDQGFMGLGKPRPVGKGPGQRRKPLTANERAAYQEASQKQAPDQGHFNAIESGAIDPEAQLDDFIDEWRRAANTIAAARLIERNRPRNWPEPNARPSFGIMPEWLAREVDLADIAPNFSIELRTPELANEFFRAVFRGPDDTVGKTKAQVKAERAAVLAKATREEYGDAVGGNRLGPAAHQMTVGTYIDEVTDLLWRERNDPDFTIDDVARLDELVPPSVEGIAWTLRDRTGQPLLREDGQPKTLEDTLAEAHAMLVEYGQGAGHLTLRPDTPPAKPLLRADRPVPSPRPRPPRGTNWQTKLPRVSNADMGANPPLPDGTNLADLEAGMAAASSMSETVAPIRRGEGPNLGRRTTTVTRERLAAAGFRDVSYDPETKLWRGVRDGTTYLIEPDGTLVLFPQYHSHWGRDRRAISLATEPSKSVTYGFESRLGAGDLGNAARGAMLEFDMQEWVDQFGDVVDRGDYHGSDADVPLGPHLADMGAGTREIAYGSERLDGAMAPNEIEAGQDAVKAMARVADDASLASVGLDLMNPDWGKVLEWVQRSVDEREARLADVVDRTLADAADMPLPETLAMVVRAAGIDPAGWTLGDFAEWDVVTRGGERPALSAQVDPAAVRDRIGALLDVQDIGYTDNDGWRKWTGLRRAWRDVKSAPSDRGLMTLLHSIPFIKQLAAGTRTSGDRIAARTFLELVNEFEHATNHTFGAGGQYLASTLSDFPTSQMNLDDLRRIAAGAEGQTIAGRPGPDPGVLVWEPVDVPTVTAQPVRIPPGKWRAWTQDEALEAVLGSQTPRWADDFDRLELAGSELQQAVYDIGTYMNDPKQMFGSFNGWGIRNAAAGLDRVGNAGLAKRLYAAAAALESIGDPFADQPPHLPTLQAELLKLTEEVNALAKGGAKPPSVREWHAREVNEIGDALESFDETVAELIPNLEDIAAGRADLSPDDPVIEQVLAAAADTYTRIVTTGKSGVVADRLHTLGDHAAAEHIRDAADRLNEIVEAPRVDGSDLRIWLEDLDMLVSGWRARGGRRFLDNAADITLQVGDPDVAGRGGFLRREAALRRPSEPSLRRGRTTTTVTRPDTFNADLGDPGAPPPDLDPAVTALVVDHYQQTGGTDITDLLEDPTIPDDMRMILESLDGDEIAAIGEGAAYINHTGAVVGGPIPPNPRYIPTKGLFAGNQMNAAAGGGGQAPPPGGNLGFSGAGTPPTPPPGTAGPGPAPGGGWGPNTLQGQVRMRAEFGGAPLTPAEEGAAIALRAGNIDAMLAAERANPTLPFDEVRQMTLTRDITPGHHLTPESYELARKYRDGTLDPVAAARLEYAMRTLDIGIGDRTRARLAGHGADRLDPEHVGLDPDVVEAAIAAGQPIPDPPATGPDPYPMSTQPTLDILLEEGVITDVEHSTLSAALARGDRATVRDFYRTDPRFQAAAAGGIPGLERPDLYPSAWRPVMVEMQRIRNTTAGTVHNTGGAVPVSPAALADAGVTVKYHPGGIFGPTKAVKLPRIRRPGDDALSGRRTLRGEMYREGDPTRPMTFAGTAGMLDFEARTSEMNQAYIDVIGSAVTTNRGSPLTAAEKQAIHDLADTEAKARLGTYATNAAGDYDRIYREVYNTELVRVMLENHKLEPWPVKGDITRNIDILDIDGDTPWLPAGLRHALAPWWDDAGPGPAVLRALRGFNRKWKGAVLPLSLRWHIGDAVSNALMAWTAGGITPVELFRQMKRARELAKTADGRRLLDRVPNERGLFFEERNWMYDRDAPAKPEPKSAVGRAVRKGVTGPIGKMIQASYRFNEFVNRMEREAVYLAKLQRELEQPAAGVAAPQGFLSRQRGVQDDITPNLADLAHSSTLKNPELADAIEKAVDRTNTILGDMANMTPWERKYVREVLPFWAWTRHVYQLATRLAIDNPARMVFLMRLGSIATDPDAEELPPFLQGAFQGPGGYWSANFINPLADVGSLPGLNVSSTLKSTSPLLKFGAAVGLGQDWNRSGAWLTRPPGTGRIDEYGRPDVNIGILDPTTVLYQATQLFPQTRQALNMVPRTRIPGTRLETGQLVRYKSGDTVTGLRGRAFPTGKSNVSSLLSVFGVPQPEPYGRVEQMQETRRRRLKQLGRQRER